jgi:hypothetical protein
MAGAQKWLKNLERDGYVAVRGFLDKGLVARARADISALYVLDRQERQQRNDDGPLFTHGTTTSVLTEPSHLLLGLPGKSAALDECYERIFTDPGTSALLCGIAGRNLKLRDVNCRLMTGTRDEGDFLNPPHEWHRDSPGEFCIAVFLEAAEEGANAATAILPGSHRFPWCPRWNALFGEPFYVNRQGGRGIAKLTRMNPFSRLFHKIFMRDRTGIVGQPGDFYIFLNDTWHGRTPNLHGGRTMIVMAGAFPTEFAFPDDPATFSKGALDRLPPRYRQYASRELPANPDRNSYIHRMLRERRRDHPASLFWWVRKEHDLIARLSVGLTTARGNPAWARLRSSIKTAKRRLRI